MLNAQLWPGNTMHCVQQGSHVGREHLLTLMFKPAVRGMQRMSATTEGKAPGRQVSIS